MTDNLASSAQIQQLGRMINGLSTDIAQVNRALSDVSSEQKDMRSDVAKLAAQFETFLVADRLAKSLQLAETKVIAVRQELETTFGNFAVVRSSAIGVLQAFDSGIVTDSSVRSVAEELMITTPSYWLAPVIVAIAAWSRDEKALAERAMAEAYRRNPDKTALFFVLVLRRFGRLTAANAWLDQYFLRQDPGRLQREFVVILEAVANGGFGPAAKQTVATHTDGWLERFKEDPLFSKKQTDRWTEEFRLLSASVNNSEFAALAKVATNWDDLQRSLGGARSHRLIGDHFDKIFTGELTVPATIQQQIDGLLSALVSEFDTEELPLRREEARLQSIIEAGGDEKRAQVAFSNTSTALDERIDFAGLLTNAAMRPQTAGVSVGTQRLAIAQSKDWVLAGFDGFTASVRHSKPKSAEFKIGSWRNIVEGSPDTDDLVASLQRHVDAETKAEVDAVKLKAPHIIAFILIPVLFILSVAAKTPFWLVIAIGLGIYGFVGYKNLDKRRLAITAAGEARRRTESELLNNACSDLVEYRRSWESEDAKAEPLRQRIDAIQASEYQLTRPNEPRNIAS